LVISIISVYSVCADVSLGVELIGQFIKEISSFKEEITLLEMFIETGNPL